MKKCSLINLTTSLAVAMAAAPAVPGQLCTIDNEPAATLLLPYFEVDLDDPSALNTRFTIENTAADAALVHLIFWTDWGAPTVGFDVFLTGYDLVEVDLASVFAGNIPITADQPRDPLNTTSPAGIVPDWDGAFDNCENFFPFFVNPVIQGTALDRLVNGHTGGGVATLGGNCLGQDHGDNVARGYITIDSVNQCSLVLDPGSSSPAYFTDGGSGIARNVNQLRGEATYLRGGNAASVPTIGVQADDTFNAGSEATGYTFYGRYTSGAGGSDNREPLASTWGVPFEANPGTELVVWRDPTADNIGPTGFECSTGPDWNPLGSTEVVCFSEAVAVDLVCDTSDCFPLATQRVTFGANGLAPGFASGWCYLNLNHTDASPTGDVDFGSPEISQSLVLALEPRSGSWGATVGTAFTSACSDASPIICPGLPGCDTSPLPATQVPPGEPGSTTGASETSGR